MNSTNDLKITYHKNYESVVKTYVEQLLHKFSLMQTPFEPLTTVLGKKWDKKILPAAAKNVLFKNYGKLVRKPSFWVLKNPTKSTEKLAQMVIEEEKRLKTMIWHINSWGNPYPTPKPAPTPLQVIKDKHLELTELYCRLELELSRLKKIIDSQ